MAKVLLLFGSAILSSCQLSTNFGSQADDGRWREELQIWSWRILGSELGIHFWVKYSKSWNSTVCFDSNLTCWYKLIYNKAILIFIHFLFHCISLHSNFLICGAPCRCTISALHWFRISWVGTCWNDEDDTLLVYLWSRVERSNQRSIFIWYVSNVYDCLCIFRRVYIFCYSHRHSVSIVTIHLGRQLR